MVIGDTYYYVELLLEELLVVLHPELGDLLVLATPDEVVDEEHEGQHNAPSFEQELLNHD